MKALFLLPLLLLAASLRAEDIPPAPLGGGTSALSTLKSELHITSRSSEVNLRSNVVVYLGNVRVKEETMNLTCEYLLAIMPQRGGRIESIVAKTNVVMDMVDDKGDKVHGTGEELLYTYEVSETATNEIVRLTGNPYIESAQGRTRADVITFNRTTGHIRFENPHMAIKHDGSLTNILPGVGPLGRTNAPPR